MQLSAFIITALVGLQADATTFSFQRTFKPPQRAQQKSDDCEILERSNFSHEEEDDIRPRFGSSGVRKQTQLVHYPYMFNPQQCCLNTCCNRDKEITVTITKSVSTTQKPKVVWPGKYKTQTEVSELTNKELMFVWDYLDDLDENDDYFDKVPEETTEKASGAEEIVIKIVEKSPPCQKLATPVSDRLDFVKVKMSDVMAPGYNCTWPR